MRVIALPANLDEAAFDPLVAPLTEDAPAGAGSAEAAPGPPLLVDAADVRWVDPYGALSVLAFGHAAKAAGRTVRLRPPASTEVTSYLRRMRFFDHASEVFELHGEVGRGEDTASDVLLEITAVTDHGDVHRVVDRVYERSGSILSKQLAYPPELAMQFGTIFSEVCQNIIEHAQAPGWVATQTYHWRRRLGRKVVMIAVMDLGVGFRGSLEGEHAAEYGGRWGDAAALEAAFMHGVTRFRDPGRGQGLQQIRRLVGRVDGRVSIRSGTARISDVPDWADTPPLEEDLPYFPGAQISIVLPAREANP
ncbi:MAG TPA: ATP-binding protein [Longimicrobiales bacterium]|nr:ATP-binding protein [Longimicrobiales bacterium]